MIIDFSLLHYYVTDAPVTKAKHILKNKLDMKFPC